MAVFQHTIEELNNAVAFYESYGASNTYKLTLASGTFQPFTKYAGTRYAVKVNSNANNVSRAYVLQNGDKTECDIYEDADGVYVLSNYAFSNGELYIICDQRAGELS